MTDEELIRQAIADEAGQAASADEVLAGLRNRRPRRPVLPVAVAALVVVAGLIAAVVVAQPFSGAPESPDAAVAAAPVRTDVLLVGTDESGRADAIVLARLGTDGVLRGVSLPRDTRVGDERLNQTYSARGADGLVAAVEKLTGVRPQHHAVVDQAAFVRLSEAVGGVEVCLRAATSDARTGVEFPAGKQTISGDRALAFLRQRMNLPNGDLDRTARQRVFLRGLTTKLAGSATELLALARDNVRTDPEFDLAGFAAAVRGAGELDVIPVLGNEPFHGGSVLAVDPAAVRSAVEAVLSGAPGSGGQDSPGGTAPCVH